MSPIQQMQMTSVLDPNVHCIAVQGTFDDCQDIVKALFRDRKAPLARAQGGRHEIDLFGRTHALASLCANQC